MNDPMDGKTNDYKFEIVYNLARMYNKYDTTLIEKYLNKNTVYESQFVFDSLKGEKIITEFLKEKFATLKNTGNRVVAEIGYLRSQKGYTVKLASLVEDEICVVLTQIREQICVPVFLKTEKKKILSIDICGVVPTAAQIDKTGIYPI